MERRLMPGRRATARVRRRAGDYTVIVDETIVRVAKHQGEDEVAVKIKVPLVSLAVAIRSLGLEVWFAERDPESVRGSSARNVSRCRSLLQAANVALPSSVREDALDEWMDEIQSAAEEGLPVRRRALSILFRTLPVAALRTRLRIRARRREG
jgi:hypothetical protein